MSGRHPVGVDENSPFLFDELKEWPVTPLMPGMAKKKPEKAIRFSGYPNATGKINCRCLPLV
jgi:hypothetical protein